MSFLGLAALFPDLLMLALLSAGASFVGTGVSVFGGTLLANLLTQRTQRPISGQSSQLSNAQLRFIQWAVEKEQMLRQTLEREYGIHPVDVRATDYGRVTVQLSTRAQRKLGQSEIAYLESKTGARVEVIEVRVCPRCESTAHAGAARCHTSGTTLQDEGRPTGDTAFFKAALLPLPPDVENETQSTSPPVSETVPTGQQTPVAYGILPLILPLFTPLVVPERPVVPETSVVPVDTPLEQPLRIKLTKTVHETILRHPDFGSVEKLQLTINGSPEKRFVEGVRRTTLLGEEVEAEKCYALTFAKTALRLKPPEQGDEWLAIAIFDENRLKVDERQKAAPLMRTVLVRPTDPKGEETKAKLARITPIEEAKPREPVTAPRQPAGFREHEEGGPKDQSTWPELPTQPPIKVLEALRALDDTCPRCDVGIVDRWSLQCNNCGAEYSAWICTICGGQIDPEYLKCTGCGRKYVFKPSTADRCT